eukprot:3266964-Rhodomonas_salina.6
MSGTDILRTPSSVPCMCYAMPCTDIRLAAPCLGLTYGILLHRTVLRIHWTMPGIDTRPNSVGVAGQA